MPSLSKVDELTTTPEQELVINYEGSLVVIGNPGAGKTEVVHRRLLRNKELNLGTLVLVFSRSAREEVLRVAPWADVYTLHSYCCREVGWMKDYPDLLYRYVLKEWKYTYDEIIVDEGQDLSPLMLDVICAIPHKTLFLVCDPYQSIYIGSWARTYMDGPAMGKDIIAALGLPTIELHGNHRSSQYVVDLLEGIYKRNLVGLGPRTYKEDAIYARSHKELNRVSNLLVYNYINHKIRRDKIDGEDNYEIIGTEEEPNLVLMVMHCCKGKQYNRGFIHDWIGSTLEDLNLLYTTAARSSKEIYVIGRKGMCRLLPEDIDLKTSKEMLEQL